MATTTAGYWRRLWAAFTGNDVPPLETGSPDEQLAAAKARAASLEMDLRERDERIAQMKAEYESLQAAKQRAETLGGQDQLERLFKRLTGPLANLAALTALTEGGKQVEAADLVSLIRSLERELTRAGLEPIGCVGQSATFDLATHQRMSGGAVRSGTPVTVQLPGYRLGKKILMKAMVSAVEDPRQEENNGSSGD